MMLTEHQRDLMLFLESYIRDHGICPSFDEIAEALRLRSKSGVHRLILALEERGFIRRLPCRARAIEILKRVENPFKRLDHAGNAYRAALEAIARGDGGPETAKAVLEAFP